MYTIHLDQSQVAHAETFAAAQAEYQFWLEIARTFGYAIELRESGELIANVSAATAEALLAQATSQIDAVEAVLHG